MDYQFGDYTLDTERYELRRAGIVVNLRPKVLEVLAYLIMHRERLVSKQELLEQLWPQQFVGEATLNSHIRAARQAVGDTGQAQRVIQTRHGRGFRFVASSMGIARSGGRAPAPQPDHAQSAGAAEQSSAEWAGMVPDDQERVEPERPEAAVVDAEHKAVTVLCAGLAEASALAAQLGPEAMHRLMQACLATAQQVLPPYGGTLTHITGEGFVALFGAPLAEEDHARRAVLAAVALQQALQERPEGVSPPCRSASGCTPDRWWSAAWARRATAVYRGGRDPRAGQPAAAAGGTWHHSPQRRHPAAGAGGGPGGRGGNPWGGGRGGPRAGVPGAPDHAAAVGGAGAWGTRLESVRRA